MAEESITQLLLDASSGKQGAVDALFPIVYPRCGGFLRPIFAGERPGHTLRAQRSYTKLTSA